MWLVGLGGPFDEDSLRERGAGSDERDEVRAVDGSPAILGGFEELVGHGQPGRAGAGSFGDSGAQPDGGEGRLDRVRGFEVNPVLGGEIVEGQQLLSVVGDLGGGLGVFRAVGLLEFADRGLRRGRGLRRRGSRPVPDVRRAGPTWAGS